MQDKCREKLTNYAAIGFDMDHTFIRYKLLKFIELVYDSTAKYLIEQKNYPKDLQPTNKDDADKLYGMFFRAVFDHKTGNLLKIGWGDIILRGYNGMRRLTREEIENQYGEVPKIADYHILSHRHEDFTNLHEFYGCAAVPTLAKLVELKKNATHGMLLEKSYYDIIDDVKESWEHNYGVNREEFRKKNYSGYFFPYMLQNPKEIVYKQQKQILKKLAEIRQKGVLLFISSNSTFEVADILMKESIGEDWLDHFDFVMYENKKPDFFRKHNDYSNFVTLDGEEVSDFGAFINKPKVGKEKVLLRGHAQHFNMFLEEKAGQNFKVLFFGDTIVSDCVYSYDKKHSSNWDVAFILEEMQELGDFKHGEYYDYRNIWGSALKEKNPYTDEDCTIIYHFARHVASAHFDKLDTLACLDYLTL